MTKKAAVGLLGPVHACVTCRELPERPFDKDDVVVGQLYRPRKPSKIVSGKTKASFRCARCARVKARADSLRDRTAYKARTYGVPRELQVALWIFQGKSCPCGRKRSEEIPAGVTLHHDRALAKAHDHPDEQGCPDCVVCFLCASCNRDVVGRLERAFRDYTLVIGALRNIADHLSEPPMRQLLREREMGQEMGESA